MRVSSKQSPAKALTVGDPLAVVPIIPVNVESATDCVGLIQVRRTDEPRSRIGRLIARTLNYNTARIVKLDDRGSFVWSHIDGRRTLREIAVDLAGKFSLAPEQSRASVILFTRNLMTRNLVQLSIQKE